ncbi:MAG TPA: ABC transporter ATP-binding protein [Syntrophales bacterium]|nr:ABC transporter ATP-binding protein [Syntrophales bacterium]HOM07684.1 ABC transporter ATP-binding protein [Syntrophales bacterium]HOO00450.1 ABC transporter ATP-binding protein [Syntrophales bacterium]HPC00840.1 ABC transporter ATP-binding protein [Syntrophales bacterium]HRS87678.1 ABC transporter ATP-binding protein [Syntrophales bacterium]
MIVLKELTKRYDRVLAVDRLSLRLEAGEIFGFIGPNGAGKTTTIRMLGGVLKPTAGAIEIGGVSLLERPVEAKRMIGFIPDRPYLYEKLTGMEFMTFTADLYGVDGDVEGKAMGLLERFDLLNRRHELIEAYSHGMRQRLIIAAALLHDPAAIVVDEPMVGLDPTAVKMVKDIFRDLARRGKTIFMSTHTLSVAEDICDRIGIIHGGSLIALGTVGDLRRSAGVGEGDLEEVFMRLTEEETR